MLSKNDFVVQIHEEPISLEDLPDEIISSHIIPILNFKDIIFLAQVSKKLKRIIETHPIEYTLTIHLQDEEQENITGTYQTIFNHLTIKNNTSHILKNEISKQQHKLNFYDCMGKSCKNFSFRPQIGPTIGLLAFLGTLFGMAKTHCGSWFPNSSSCDNIDTVILTSLSVGIMATISIQLIYCQSTNFHYFFNQKAHLTTASIHQNQDNLRHITPTMIEMGKIK